MGKLSKLLFTDEHRKRREKLKNTRKKEREQTIKDWANDRWTRETAKPKLEDRPKPAPSFWSSNKVTQISRGNNSANVNISGTGYSYQRTVNNGKETVIVNGQVLTGDEARAAKKKYENWVDNFTDDMSGFADDMRDMLGDMKDMFK